MSDSEAYAALYEWRIWARENQVAPPGTWTTWLVLAGRGFGKTRTGAEWIRERIASGARRIAIAGRTSADVRDVMIEGESGVLACCPDHDRPHYEPSKRRLTWPNGAMATTYSADEPDQARGPQHDTLWADELAAWRFPDAWDQLTFGLRLGSDPRALVTTTPRPTQIIRMLLADANTVITRGATRDNAANLAPAFLGKITARYAGTRLARQELDGELLLDIDGAIVTHDMIDAVRVATAPDLRRIVIAIDPAVTSGDDADETGIIVAGLGFDSHVYVLDDLTCRVSPDKWARRAVEALDRYGADRIVAERNNGGDMVEAVLRQVRADVPITTVVATRGKHVRFEPVGALYEQGRVHHVGAFAALEDQICAFTPAGYEGDASPDRADALVWNVTDLALGGGVTWGSIYGAA